LSQKQQLWLNFFIGSKKLSQSGSTEAMRPDGEINGSCGFAD